MGKQWKECQTLFFGAPKSLQMVTAAMKLKDTYSLINLERWDGEGDEWEVQKGEDICILLLSRFSRV